MAVIMPKSAFIHVPKTGGTWCRMAIKAAKIKCIEAQCRPIGHSDLVRKLLNTHAPYSEVQPCVAVCNWLKDDEHPAERFMFGFLRNPLKWLISRWADAIRKYGGVADHDIAKDGWFKKVFSINFSTYIDNIIRVYPDVVSDALLGRLGYHKNKRGIWVQDARPIDFIGKTEHLVEDFIKALTLAGEKFNPDRIRNVPPQRVAGKLYKYKKLANYTNKQKQALYDANKQLFDWFGYTI